MFLFIHFYHWLLLLVGTTTAIYYLAVNVFSFTFISVTLYSFIILYYWFRDFIREYNKRIPLLTAYVVAIFITFVIEESLLFISFFWGSYHQILSPLYNFCEGLMVYDALVTWTNTLILSNAALALSGIIYNYYINGPVSYVYGFILGSLFLMLQLKEYRYMGTNINDQWSVFYIITGLHCFHVIVGLVILPVYFQTTYFLKDRNVIVFRVTSFLQMILVYWHLVEMLWIFIFLSNYL